MKTASDRAWTALAAIRAVNGALGLFAPRAMARRVGEDPDAAPGFAYPARMFGVRTLLLSYDALTLEGAARSRQRTQAVVVHGADTLAAAYAGWRGQLAPRAAALTTAISALNTTLALISVIGDRREPAG